jgi:hypothetical protein
MERKQAFVVLCTLIDVSFLVVMKCSCEKEEKARCDSSVRASQTHAWYIMLQFSCQCGALFQYFDEKQGTE